MRRVVAAGALAMALALPLGGVAQACESEPSNKHYPSSCLYEVFWTKDGCTVDGVTAQWVIPAERTVETTKPKPKRVKVKRGQTLWRLAVIHRGNGHEWKTIARLNGIKGTTIYAGQTLRVR